MSKIELADTGRTDEITELLNKVTLNLHEKGINQWTFPWDKDKLRTDIEERHVYVLMENDIVAGTFSMKHIDKFEPVPIESSSMYLYRIAVLPEYQGNNLGMKIMQFACQASEKLRKSLYLDCWAGNKKLRSFYSGAGLEYLGDFPEEDYMISVFKKDEPRGTVTEI